MGLDLAWILVYEVLLNTDNRKERTSVRLTWSVSTRSVRLYEAQTESGSWSVDVGPWFWCWTLPWSVRGAVRGSGDTGPWSGRSRLPASAALPPTHCARPTRALRVNTGFSFPAQHSFRISPFLTALGGQILGAFGDPFQFLPSPGLGAA